MMESAPTPPSFGSFHLNLKARVAQLQASHFSESSFPHGKLRVQMPPSPHFYRVFSKCTKEAGSQVLWKWQMTV